MRLGIFIAGYLLGTAFEKWFSLVAGADTSNLPAIAYTVLGIALGITVIGR